MKYKNIRLKIKNGKSRLQRVQVLASGKYKFVKNLSTSSSRNVKKNNTRSVKKMARRKIYYRKKSTPKGMLSGVGRYAGPIAYGAFRGKISDFIKNSKIGQSFPASNYTDEMLMFGALTVASKLGVGKSGIMRSVIAHGKTIELSRIGETLAQTGLSLGTTANNSQFD